MYTTLADVTANIQTNWSPIFTKRLRASLLLAGLVNKDYEGAIVKGGDTVRVQQVVDPTGQLLDVGGDTPNADTFQTESIQTAYVDIKADKRAVAAYDFSDLVELQSMIDRDKVQEPMINAIATQMNNYIWTVALATVSASTPDMIINSVSTLDKTAMRAARVLAGEQLWPQDGDWFGLVSPAYWGDQLVDTTLASNLYVGDAPIAAGQKARRLMGFNLFEDNSRTGTLALLFHRNFLHLVQQTQVQVKLSDKHVLGQFGIKMSVDVIFGAKAGLQAANKVMQITNV